LTRLRSPILRARLKFLIGRSALSPVMEESRTFDGPLGARMLRDLFDGAEGISSEEGLPLDLLAAYRLVDLDEATGGGLRNAAVDRLRKEERGLSTPILEAFVGKIAPRDERLLGDWRSAGPSRRPWPRMPAASAPPARSSTKGSSSSWSPSHEISPDLRRFERCASRPRHAFGGNW